MQSIVYIDRTTKEKRIEKVFGARGLEFLYGDFLISKTIGRISQCLIARIPLFSYLYGKYQKSAFSKKQIAPFIEEYNIDIDQFEIPSGGYPSFNDFFIRKVKKEARPICNDNDVAIIPADGRYYAYQNISTNDHFIVKGQKFNLERFLLNKQLAKRFDGGSMLLGRLCPSDYHRFHFPTVCLPTSPKLIRGSLFSVNPIAVNQHPAIFWRNKRVLTEIHSHHFGSFLYIEIGATCVGSIHQTFAANVLQNKGEEKGFFAFGASAVALLFEKDTILLDRDIIENTKKGFETLCLLGQSAGRKKI